MRILVINLDRSPDRLGHMHSVFAERGLSFERVAAVDAHDLGEEEIARWRQGVPSFYVLGAGEVGCFLSHRKCWQIAAASREPFTVICEDDIFLGRNADAILGRHDWIPTGAGIVKLEVIRQKVLLGRQPVVWVEGRSVHRLLRDFAGSGCYVVSREGAARLLVATTSFCDPVDQYLFHGGLPHSHGEAVFQLVPGIAIQEYFLRRPFGLALGSTLQGERRTKRRTGMKKIAREICRPLERTARSLTRYVEGLSGNRCWRRVPFR